MAREEFAGNFHQILEMLMVKVLVYAQHELSARVNVIDKVCRREASRLFCSSSTSEFTPPVRSLLGSPRFALYCLCLCLDARFSSHFVLCHCSNPFDSFLDARVLHSPFSIELQL